MSGTVRTPRATRFHPPARRIESHTFCARLLTRANSNGDDDDDDACAQRTNRASVFGVIVRRALVLRPGSARARDHSGVKP
mmetsp:Transcript_5908/g.19838  ORF Transcript_5908/g.19838 Transcript_5908/m.19838 type:complete len:81 (-) Transcript_5908:5437-5679(-)